MPRRKSKGKNPAPSSPTQAGEPQNEEHAEVKEISEHMLIAYLSYMAEKKAIKEHDREYRRRYYAERRRTARENNLRRMRGELSDDNSENRRRTRSGDKVRTTQSTAEASNMKPGERRPRGKRAYNSEGLIMLYCENCDTSRRKINYRLETVCRKCKRAIKFQCIKCSLTYKSHTACVAHLQGKHPDAEPEF
ncbi:uncharacterized protein LOC103316291 [Nasonia vitripennis]|uniref:C2H2-type domain-containing protein n=1 Tax=Nasonia vitripennis TaxID=7425 RepID=A0A7M7QIQ0_NASVI|nr:uncharacterized protein LOC103316291 [Nasonia vitripennis]